MAKLSDKIDLSKAMQEAQAEFIIDSSGSMAEPVNPVEALLNSGVKAHKERTKKQEYQKTSERKAVEENSLFAELLPKEEEKPAEQKGEKWPKTYEETCEYELRRAHQEGWEDPDFDFRKTYAKGQHLWYVRILSSLGEKEMFETIVQTVYPRTIILAQPKAFCHCVGYKMRDQLFYTQMEAAQFFETVKVSSRYKTEHPMRRKDDDADDGYDEDDEQSSQKSLEELMNGGDENE